MLRDVPDSARAEEPRFRLAIGSVGAQRAATRRIELLTSWYRSIKYCLLPASPLSVGETCGSSIAWRPKSALVVLFALSLLGSSGVLQAQLSVSRSYSDVAGDAVALDGVELDLTAAAVSIDASSVRFNGVLASPGQFEPAFGGGRRAVPAARPRYLGMIYALEIDADDDPATGRAGVEYSLEVTFEPVQSDPTDPAGDFSAGVMLGDDLVGLLRSFAADGSPGSARRMTGGVARSGSDFSFVVPRALLSLGPNVAVRVVSRTFGTDGRCANTQGQPNFCVYESDSVPDKPAETGSGGGGDTVQFGRIRYAGRESDGRVTVDVEYLRSTANGPAAVVASVDVRVTGGSADGGDFVGPTAQTVTFANGASTAEVEFELVDDSLVEASETILLELSDPDGVGLGVRSAAIVVILDDDVAVAGPGVRVASQGARAPRIVTSDGGLDAVVWEQGSPGGLVQVHAQVFAPSGEPVTAPFAVDPDSRFHQLRPDATFAGETLGVVFERRSVATGEPVDIHGVAVREPTAPGAGFRDQLPILDGEGAKSPRIATVQAGLIVTWNEDGLLVGQELGGASSQRFIVAAAAPDSVAEVASSALGDYVVCWRDGSPSGLAQIYLRRYGRGGRELGGVTLVDEAPGADRPVVGMAPNGDLVVIYERSTSLGTAIWGAAFDWSGLLRVVPHRLSRSAGEARRPTVSVNSAGDVVVVWQRQVAARALQGEGNLVARFFDPMLEPVVDELEVTDELEEDEAAEPEVSLDDDDGTTVVFTRRDPGGGVEEIFRTDFQPSIAGGSCSQVDDALCLGRERFKVEATWQDAQGNTGRGRAVPITDDSGFVWFFEESNAELVVKILNGCAVNERFWVFAGGLTDVGVTLTIDDTLTGVSSSYVNPVGVPFVPIQDIDALDACTAEDESGLSEPSIEAESPDSSSEIAPCDEDEEQLCLGAEDRFRVSVHWSSPQGASGAGSPVRPLIDTGYFWFFDPENVELVVKVLDGCALNGHFWIFAGGLTDVETTLTVSDTVTGATKVYTSAQGEPFVPILDAEALLICSEE